MISAPDQPGGAPEWAATDVSQYALIGDCETAALVSSRGSIDWLCWPRFDSDACLAALLGGPDCGCWTISLRHLLLRSRRRYLPDTLIVETEMQAQEGELRLIDFMPFRASTSDMVHHHEGPDVPADRRNGRCADDIAHRKCRSTNR